APLFQRAAIHSRPTKKQPPDEWAAENRTYPPTADRPGPRNVKLTPYVIDFERAGEDHRYDTAALVCGAQMGKSEADLDIIGQTLDQRPASIIYVAPTEKFLREEIEPRVSALISESPSLRRKAGKSTKSKKVVGGVAVRMLWAGSASQLSGTTAKIALVDELDRMVTNVQGDGDALSLVDARGFAHKDRKRFVTSTPKCGNADIVKDEVSGLELWKRMPPEDIESPIWRLWQRGTMHHFTCPCPQCGDYFVPRFKQLRWPNWPELCSSAEAKRGAYIECPSCHGVIEEHDKAEMNARGCYVAPGQTISRDGIVSGDPPDTTTVSYWVSGLCSPFVTIGERAAAYIYAKESGSQEKLQAVINTGFGELWAPGSGDVPEWQEVAALKRDYRKLELPKGLKVLTLTADVQKRRIVYTIRGWGARASSWLIDFGELHGPTTEDDVWHELGELLHRPIGDMAVWRAFIDSGFRPGKPDHVPVNKVYDFCRKFPRLAWPTKGYLTLDKPLIVSKIEVTSRGSAKKYGLDLVRLDTDYFKSWVHERVRWEPDKPGAWLLPADTTDDYCKQIVAEARIKKPNGQPEWVPRSRENHFLDCEAMQAAVGHMLNVHLYRLEEPETEAETPMRVTVASRPRPGSVVKPKPTPATVPQPVVAEIDTKAARKERIAKLAARMRAR
ncbi:MAG: terminase gpA endonuclease subunit, partial [Hyphomicrobium sp.]